MEARLDGTGVFHSPSFRACSSDCCEINKSSGPCSEGAGNWAVTGTTLNVLFASREAVLRRAVIDAVTDGMTDAVLDDVKRIREVGAVERASWLVVCLAPNQGHQVQ